MHRSLRTTTAILTSFALIIPGVAPAQDSDAPAAACADGTEPPCEPAAAVDETEQSEAGSSEVEAVESEVEPAAEPLAEIEPEQAAEETTEETEPSAEATPEATEDNGGSEATAEVEEAPAADDNSVVGMEAAPIVKAPALVEEGSSEPIPAEEPEPNEQVMEEPTPIDSSPELTAEEEPAPEADTQPVAEANPPAEEVVSPAPEAQADGSEADGSGDADAVASEAPEVQSVDAPTEGTTEDAGSGGLADALKSVQDGLAGTPAALATGDAEQTGEVTSETVTDDTARTSQEDFGGAINAEAGAATEAESDSGLSKFEKALIVGAGALVVGSIIKGNREVVSTSEDRLVVSRSDGGLEVLKDDNALLRQPGSQIETQTYSDGSTRSVTTRDDGSQVITVRDANLRVLRRVLVRTDGSEVLLIDDTAEYEPVDVSLLPTPAPARAVQNEDDLRTALAQQGAFERRFSLSQIRQIKEVRELAPSVEVDTITFESGSAAIAPVEAEKLTQLGLLIAQLIAENPNEIFLVEGHTDAVGPASTNLILSDRRAESLALALTEYFDVPPENLVVQGYGEADLKIPTETAEQANRRAGLRRITQLMQVAG